MALYKSVTEEDQNGIFEISLDRDELHRWLGGGIPRGSLLLIDGEEGSGKSLLTQRLLFGFLKNGATCSYLSTELSLKGFLGQMNSLNYDVSKFILEGRLFFASPYLSYDSSTRKAVNPLGTITSSKNILGNDVIIIDSLEPLIFGTRPTQDLPQIVSLIKRISGSGRVVIMTNNSRATDNGLVQALERVSEIQIRLELVKLGSDIKRRITMVRFQKPRQRVVNMIGFRVEPQVGLIIEISAVA